jgi:hypothetical protein
MKEPGIGRDVLSVIIILTAIIVIAPIVIAIAYIDPDLLRKPLEHLGLHELMKLLRKLI